MKVSTETGIQFGTSEELKTDVATNHFYLKIVIGKGHFTTKKVFKPVASTFSVGAVYTGSYWDNYDEAFAEGKTIIERAQEDFEKDIEALRSLYQ